jgi:putative transcriptional regulator
MAVLEKKREITRFQILVEVAASQPQIKQSDIAATLGITPQAVSEYIKDLVAEGMITSRGRGQYSVTPLGVEYIISDAKELKEYSDYVLKSVVGQVTVWAAIAREKIRKDSPVYVTMQDGMLYCSNKNDGGAEGIAINDSEAGMDVGVTNLKGLIPLTPENVTLIRIPSIIDGGSHKVDVKKLRASISGIVCIMGEEALSSVKVAGIKPDAFFGALDAAIEAAIKGVKSTLIITMDNAPNAIQRFESAGINYRVVDVLLKSK